MSVNATTAARVKALLPKTDSGADTFIDGLIAAVSREVEGVIGYELEQKARTEFYDVEHGSRILFLKNAPVVSVADLRIAPEGWDFTAATPLVANTDYRLTDGFLGRIYFFVRTFTGRETIKVTYTAGVGVDTAAVIAAAPEISAAVEMQVAEEYRRRNTPTSEMRTGAAGGSRAFTGHHRFMPRVLELLEGRRRIVA